MEESKYSRFMKLCENILCDKANARGITEEELDSYFSPVSLENIDKYYRVFGVNFDINKDYKNFLFARFTASLYNSGYKHYMTNIPDKQKELAKALKEFNLEVFKSSYESPEDLSSQILSNKKEYKSLNTIKSKNLNNICKGIYQIATHLDEHNYKMFDSTVKLSKDEYVKSVLSVINKNSFKDIYGMGFALFSDAVKESSILDVPKPDVHIIDILNAAFPPKEGEFKRPENSKQLEGILDVFYDISQATGYSIYKIDKVLWLVAAKPGTDFYLHLEKKQTNYKDKLLKSIKENLVGDNYNSNGKI